MKKGENIMSIGEVIAMLEEIFKAIIAAVTKFFEAKAEDEAEAEA